MLTQHGTQLRDEILQGTFLPFIGIYDLFSASLAARHFNGLFLSGFSFAASFYGLPDIGFNCWTDLVAFAQRVRQILPKHHLLVDIDDGFGDSEIACHVVSVLEAAGASGVIMEDQKRPRRCGHYPGKHLLEINEFRVKLSRALETRQNLVIIARTDATDPEDRIRRAEAYSACGADAVLVEAIPDLQVVQDIRSTVKCPIMINQIVGGKSPLWSFRDLREGGVDLVNYSTPCLLGAQQGIEHTLSFFKAHDGQFPPPKENEIPGSLESCTNLLYENVKRRDQH